MNGQMGSSATQATAMALLAALLAGCAQQAELTVKENYLAKRLYAVNRDEPCTVEPYAPIPVKLIHNAVLLPVIINGVQTIGRLDTGARASLITPELAAAAHVKTAPSRARMSGISGSFPVDLALIDHLQVGSIDYHGKRLGHVYPFAGSQGARFGVLVGLDWLDKFDFDMDLAHERLQPFRTANCLEVPVPWPDTYTGLALSRGVADGLKKHQQDAAAVWGFGFHVSIPVAFEGGLIEATIDTGAERSFLSYDAARQAGATAAQLETDPKKPAAGINGSTRNMAYHRFPDLAIGEEELRDFSIMVAPAFDRRDLPMILGMDYLGNHHLWLSLTTNALYIDSGERRKLLPPIDQARQVGGPLVPTYPQDARQESGVVRAQCFVQTDGGLTDCRVTDDGGDPAFGRATMAWLTGAASPIMQPGHQNGSAVRQSYQWTFTIRRPQLPQGPVLVHDTRKSAK